MIRIRRDIFLRSSPSPGIPGEGRGGGLYTSGRKGPHPNPPPAYRERGPKRRRAFTLLELLVALGMVAIISLSMFQSLRVAVRAKNSAEAAVAPSRSIDIAMDLIRSDIANVMPPNKGNVPSDTADTTTDTGTVLFLAGNFSGAAGQDGHELTLFTTADGPTHDYGDGEIRQVLLKIVNVDNDRVLVRHVNSNVLNPQPPTLDTMDKEVICRGVASFNVRYFDGSEWQESWDAYNENTDTNGNPELPAAVEVTLDLVRKNEDGSVDTSKPPLHYVRIFPISCSTLINDLNSSTTSTTGGGGS